MAAASQLPSPAHAVPVTMISEANGLRTSLRVYLGSVLYRNATLAFERLIYPFVKEKMQRHFKMPTHDEYIVGLHKWNEDKKRKITDLQKVVAAREIAFRKLEKERKDSPESFHQRKKAYGKTRAGLMNAKKQLEKEQERQRAEQRDDSSERKFRDTTGLQPLWVRRCRQAFPNDRIRQFVTADAYLDLYKLTAIMQYFLPEVFESSLQGDVFEVKGLLLNLRFASETRNRRAHETSQEVVPLSEAGILDALRVMLSVLEQCNFKQQAEKEFKPLLEQAQKLMAKAKAPSSTVAPVEKVTLTEDEWDALVVHQALNDFERRMQQHVAPDFDYRNQTIVFEQADTWDPARQQRVKMAGNDLRIVCKARHWIFHNTGVKLDVHGALKAMGDVLSSLHGVGFEQTPKKETWPWAEILSCTGKRCLEVTLRVSDHGMNIPYPRDLNFVGRDKEKKALCDAIIQRSTGPILVHGGHGMGKDALTAETLRMREIAQCPDIRLAMWLQGSTNALFCSQLVLYFRAANTVVKSSDKQEDALVAIRKWLSEHSYWLMVVEDATEKCDGLYKYVPVGSGRVVITSSERLDETKSNALGIVKRVEVLPLETRESIKMWQCMNLFRKQPVRVSAVAQSPPSLSAKAAPPLCSSSAAPQPASASAG